MALQVAIESKQLEKGMLLIQNIPCRSKKGNIMKTSIDVLAKRQFEIVKEKKKLQVEENELKKNAMEEIIRMQAWDLVSINWDFILPQRIRKKY